MPQVAVTLSYRSPAPYWDEPLHEPYVQPSGEQPNSLTRSRPLIHPAPCSPVKARGRRGAKQLGELMFSEY